MTQKHISRREALRRITLGTAGSFLLGLLPWKSLSKPTTERSRVILIRDKNLLDSSGNINPRVLESMMDQAITMLTGAPDAQNAWKTLIQPEDVVGIKSNVWSRLPTPVELEQYIKGRIMEVGVREKNISIDDRGIHSNPIFQNSTALINARPMRTHDWSGVGSLLKNYIMFTSKPYLLHGDNCADLAKMWLRPEVKGKTRLNILVMITPLFHGVGPHHFNTKFTWQYNGLIVSKDPVAADATGLRIIQAKRNEYFGRNSPISPSPKHIELADTRHHLGNASPEKIELIQTGWKEGILI